jgi:phosphoglycerol transferase
MTKKRKRIISSISIILFIFSILILIAIAWFKKTFSNVTIDELIFHLKVPLTGSNTSFISNYFNYAKDYLIIIVLIAIGVLIYHSDKFNHKYQYNINK